MSHTTRHVSVGLALSLGLHAALWIVDGAEPRPEPPPPAPVAFAPVLPGPLPEPEPEPAPQPEPEPAPPVEPPPAPRPEPAPAPTEPPAAEPERPPPAATADAAPRALDTDAVAPDAALGDAGGGGDGDAVPLRIRWRDRREIAHVTASLGLAVVAVRNAVGAAPEIVAELTFRSDGTPQAGAPRESYAGFSNRVRELPARLFRGHALPAHDRILAFVPTAVDAAWARTLDEALAAAGPGDGFRAAVADFEPGARGPRLVVRQLVPRTPGPR